MELTRGRLTAALIAGKIPVTDQALKFLQAGLVTIARGYLSILTVEHDYTSEDVPKIPKIGSKAVES